MHKGKSKCQARCHFKCKPKCKPKYKVKYKAKDNSKIKILTSNVSNNAFAADTSGANNAENSNTNYLPSEKHARTVNSPPSFATCETVYTHLSP